MTSIASSTVTIPTSLPSLSTTGSASIVLRKRLRNYFLVLIGIYAYNIGLHYVRHYAVIVGNKQLLDRHGTYQFPVFGNIACVYRFLVDTLAAYFP